MQLIAVIQLVRAHWKLAAIGLMALALAVQTVRLGLAENRADKLRIANNELRAELKSISDKRNEQKAETSRRIDRAERGNKEADKIARKIEEAPLPGQCKTPAEIMGADL